MIAGSEMIKSLLVFQYHQNRRYNSCIIFFQGALKSFRPSLDLSMSQTYHRAISVVRAQHFSRAVSAFKVWNLSTPFLQQTSSISFNVSMKSIEGIRILVPDHRLDFKTKFCFLSESNQEKASNKLFSQKGDYFITFNWITETYRSPL